jgi:hypothetical protein
MNTLERALYRDWQRHAMQRYIGTCDICGRNRIPVARQRRRRKRECFECYAERVG